MTGDHHLDLNEKDYQNNPVDTKSKILIIILFIIISLFIISFEQLLILWVIGFWLVTTFKAKFGGILKKSLLPLPLLVSLALISFFSESKNTELGFSNVEIGYNNLELTCFYFLRSLIIVFVSISLVESEDSFFEVIYALDSLGLPDVIVSILLLMYRSSLDLYVEAKRMIDVRYSRSTYRRWGTNFYTYRILGYMLGSILMRSLIKRDLRRDSLYSRNYTGKLYYKKKQFRFKGLLLLWIVTIVMILTLLLVEMHFLPFGVRTGTE